MTIKELISDLPNRNIVSETDVHTKFAIDLFKLLDYPDRHRADKFPIYIYEGSTSKWKEADIVYFDSPDHASHHSREDHQWVEDHSLVVVELKSPEESISVKPQGQASSYAIWGRIPFYVITNGKEIAVYRLNSLISDSEELNCAVKDLPKHMALLRRLLHPRAVQRYIEQNKLKSRDPEETDYSDYIRSKNLELQLSLNGSLLRTISDYPELPQFRMYVSSSPDHQKESFKSVPATDLLKSNNPVIVLAEPGGGKTYFSQMIAQTAINNLTAEEDKPIPIILLGQDWKKRFNSIPEGICKEVKPFVPKLDESIIINDVRKQRFLLLIDGLDEATEDLDLLHRELTRIVKDSHIQTIVTDRKGRYYGDLQPYFATLEIDPLTDSQVEEYASHVLKGQGRNFLWGLEPSLAELAHNPLLLKMIVEIAKDNTNKRLPNNKSGLYSAFIDLLLTGRPKNKRISELVTVPQKVKELILAEYAHKTFRRGANTIVFTEVLNERRGIDDPKTIRREIFYSGLIKEESAEPEFLHPSFQEYFLALDLASKFDEEAPEFISNNHSKDAYTEVFIFLSGLLKNEQQQSFLLDYLEANNLKLFRSCLEARFKRSEPTEEVMSQDYIRKYLGQIRSSYIGIIEHHFKELKYLFHPWRRLTERPLDTYPDAEIRGAITEGTARIYYEFNVAPPDSDNANRVITLTLPDASKAATPLVGDESIHERLLRFVNGSYTSLRLDKTGRNIGAARDVAFNRIKKTLKDIFDHQDIYDENLILGCEYVRTSLEFLSRFKEFKGLSLNLPLEQLINTLESYPGGVFRSNRMINLTKMVSYLTMMKEQGINPIDLTLPPPDLSWGDVPDEKWLWARYTEAQLVSRINKFYEFFQQSYRWMVERYFQPLKDHFSFYHVGPVKFYVSIYNWNSENASAHVAWEPVSFEADRTTEVSFKTQWDNDEERYVIVGEKLKALGRNWKSMYGTTLRRLGRHFSDRDIIHEEVYEQLSKDMEGIIGKPSHLL